MTDVARGEEVGRTNGIAGQELAKSATGIRTTRSPAAGCRAAGRRSSAAAPDAARRCSRGVPRARAPRVRRARRLHGVRGDRRGADPERPLARLRPRRADRRRRSWSSITSTSSAARSRRPASTTSKGCSSASATPSTPSAPSASCSTPSRRCSAASTNHAILRAELRRLFRWLKDKGVTAIITGERGEGRSPGTGSRSTSPIA